MVCAHITDAPAWAGVVLPAQQGGARRPEDRPLAKATALPPRYSKFNGFEKSAVVLTFVLESYQPYCAPQADQKALWRSLLH